MYHETRSVFSDIHLPDKNNTTTPRPITDLGIRRALKKDDVLRGLPVPPKDEKILKLMVKKGEGEKTYWKDRLNNSLAWDTEKIVRDDIKLEKNINHRAKIEIMREEDRQMVYMKKLNRQKKRLKRRADMVKELEKASNITEQALDKQRKIKEDELAKLIQKEEQNKEKQEKNWWDVNSKEYEKKLQEKMKHDKDMLKADERRQELIHQEIEKIAEENESERLTFTERYVLYEKRCKKSRKTLTARIERRHSNALSNYDHATKEKIEKIHADTNEEEKKFHQAITTQSKIQKKNQKRAKKMLQKTKEDIEHATETAAKTKEELAQKIHTELETKEKEQKKHLKKIRKETRKWRKQIAKEVKQKEEKMLEIQEERSKVMEKTRSIAQRSSILRTKVMDRYGSEDFDKKLFRVERFKSLGNRPTTQEWNTSSISLL